MINLPFISSRIACTMKTPDARSHRGFSLCSICHRVHLWYMRVYFQKRHTVCDRLYVVFCKLMADYQDLMVVFGKLPIVCDKLTAVFKKRRAFIHQLPVLCDKLMVACRTLSVVFHKLTGICNDLMAVYRKLPVLVRKRQVVRGRLHVV